MAEVRFSPDLPPHFARLYNPEAKQYFTPLDDRGIADIDAVFELALRTYPYTLPSFSLHERNKHHVYWSESWWENFANQQATREDWLTVTEFRNGTPQKAFVPPAIHRWIEHSQIPPPAPSLETMRRRNSAWASASLLLKSCIELDRAREEYRGKKGQTRRLLGSIAGITPLSQRFDEPYIDVIDDDYWLSELDHNLSSWRRIAAERGEQAVDEGLIARPRLAEVRELRQRVRVGAIIPKLPDFLLAA